MPINETLDFLLNNYFNFLGFLDAIRHGQEQVLGDLSMTLCDPFAINFLASSAIKIINHQVTNEALPRENAILHLLLRMMGLGLSAWDMIDTQEFMEPKLNTGLITQFVPSLMSLVVDDQIRSLNAKLPADEHESAITIIDHTGPPPGSYRGFIEQNTVATTLAMHYTIQVSQKTFKQGFVLHTLWFKSNDFSNLLKYLSNFTPFSQSFK